MSNHLNSLLEAIGKHDLYFHHGIDEKIAEHVKRSTQIVSSLAVCFDAGDMDEVFNFQIIDDLIKLPFDEMWIEADTKDVKAGHDVMGQILYSTKNDIGENVINAHVFRKTPGRWLYEFSWEYCKGEYRTGNCDKSAPKEFVQIPPSLVFRFLSALNCTNVNRIEHKPSEKLQKSRAKRGKQPLFSYWTLEIDLPKSRAAGEDYGGTHASPRLHLRRGHPRQYAPGKYCWVQPCVVGNKAAGMVHKDYAVKHAA